MPCPQLAIDLGGFMSHLHIVILFPERKHIHKLPVQPELCIFICERIFNPVQQGGVAVSGGIYDRES